MYRRVYKIRKKDCDTHIFKLNALNISHRLDLEKVKKCRVKNVIKKRKKKTSKVTRMFFIIPAQFSTVLLPMAIQKPDS